MYFTATKISYFSDANTGYFIGNLTGYTVENLGILGVRSHEVFWEEKYPVF